MSPKHTPKAAALAAAKPAAMDAPRLLLLALLAAALTLLAGCADKRGGSIPYEPTGFVAPDAPSTTALDLDYRIAPLDKLKVTVFQVPDLSGEFDVDLTGNIGLPLIGNVRAVDLTTDQLDARITQALGAKYLQNPDVSVGISKSTSRVVTVDGSVRQPGQFAVAGPTSLMQVIAMARGTDENANPRRVAIFRQIQGQRMAAAFDLTAIRRGTAEDPRVYSGDIVVVDGSKVKAIQREVLTALPIFSIFKPF
ncbi:MAG TPA: polysaccharide biosynthesis/export family protein [Allosphingosinicella sp.]